MREWVRGPFIYEGGPPDFPPPLSINLTLILTCTFHKYYGGCLFLSLILLIIGQPPSLVGHEAPCHKSYRLTFSIKFQPQKIRSGILKTTRHKKTFLHVLITIHHKKTFPGVLITIHHKKHPSSCCKHKPPHS